MGVAQRVVAHCGMGRTLQEALARDGLFRWPAGRGKDWHVDTERGSASNSGERADDALNTITAALTKCVANRRDNIIVHDWQTDNDETWPLPMNVAGVSLYGMPSGVLSPGHDSMARLICPDDAAVIAISAHQCRVIQCYLQCPAGYDAITFSGTPAWTGILGNYFQTCKDAVGGGALASTSIGWLSEISYNTFYSLNADHGIYQFNPSNLLIKGNLFLRVGGDAALELSSAAFAKILDNRFALLSDTKGGAITLTRDAHCCLIDGNRANYQKTAMSANPYLDTSSGGATGMQLNDWLLNYQAITATQPDTS